MSTGFVARAHERLADRLDAAGFDEAMRTALRAELVLCADETPATLRRYCRVRSYLVSARGHGIRAIDAALAGDPWLPVPVAA